MQDSKIQLSLLYTVNCTLVLWRLFSAKNLILREFVKIEGVVECLLILRREMKEGEGDRANYRRAAGEGADKAADAGPGAAPMEFRGGYGRGKAPQ